MSDAFWIVAVLALGALVIGLLGVLVELAFAGYGFWWTLIQRVSG